MAAKTALRELLTSPSGTISFVISAASSYLDITASRAFDIPGSAPLRSPAQPTSAASAAQTTLAAFYRSTLEGHRILTHILTCSPTLPRPTFVASAAKQTSSRQLLDFLGPQLPPTSTHGPQMARCPFRSSNAA
ncbi:hypothetical protein FOXYSP1_19325 [Fusarium oxysporum f. sp. phaseoli]